MIFRAVLVAVVTALTLGALPAHAQGLPGSPDGAARALANAWSRADADAMEPLLAPQGLTLRLDGPRRVGVVPRQARASLAEFLGRHDAGEVRVRRTEALGGDPPRAFAELEWAARPTSTRDTSVIVIFVGLERAEEGWVVSEIRVLS